MHTPMTDPKATCAEREATTSKDESVRSILEYCGEFSVQQHPQSYITVPNVDLIDTTNTVSTSVPLVEWRPRRSGESLTRSAVRHPLASRLFISRV